MRKRNRHKIIIGIEVMILSITVSLLGTNAASSNPPSNGVSYNKNGQVTVENALDNLYSKANYGNATANDILKGKKALVGGKEVVGTLTIPTLASQTPGDATPEDIAEGKIAWVNGNRIVGARKALLANEVKLGDYISYTPSKTSYTISKEDTAYTEDQKINPSELNLWRVIRKNGDGTLELISEYVSSSGLKFGDRSKYGRNKAYINYVGTLNKIAKQYETDGYTIGSRHYGYDKSITQEYLNIEITEDDSISNTNEMIVRDGALNDWYLVYRAIGDYSVGKVDKPDKSFDYWSAARNGCYNVSSSRGFQCQVHVAGLVNSSNADDILQKTNERYVRPIVVLKPNLKITSGNGTADAPYILRVYE